MYFGRTIMRGCKFKLQGGNLGLLGVEAMCCNALKQLNWSGSVIAPLEVNSDVLQVIEDILF